MSRPGGYGTQSGSPYAEGSSGLTLQPTELQPHGEGPNSSDCPHGCDELGFLYVESSTPGQADTAYPCPCRAGRMRTKRAAALTKRKREQCRRAGKASGRVRKRLAKRRRTLRGHELPLVWRVRQITRTDFERAYRRMCAKEGLVYDTRGLHTAYELYRIEWAAYRAQGQDFQTTNGQRSRALALRGRARCRRTVQRTRRRLQAMGLLAYTHIRRGGWRPGQKDSLRVHVIPRVCTEANVTPLTGAEGDGLRPSTPSALQAGVPPPTAADEVERAPSASVTTSEGAPSAPARASGEGGSFGYGAPGLGQSSSLSVETTSAGLRWSQ